MKRYALFCASLLAVMSGCAAAASIGYETFSLQPDGSVVTDRYSDSGALVGRSVAPGFPWSFFAASLVTNTLYLDPTALGNALPATSALIQEDFNNPTNLSISEPLTYSACDPRYGNCSNPPASFLSVTASVDGTSISGNVGDCSGVPRCLSPTGWQYSYIVDLHFNRPIVGLAVTNGLMQGVNLSTLIDNISLPTDDLFGFGFGGSPDFNGWVFPNGVSDVYLDYYGIPSNSHNGMFGPMPFTLSNLEIAVGPLAPEPSTAFLAIAGLLGIISLTLRRRASQ